MDIQEIAIDRLCGHPANSNVMGSGLFKKLVGHLKETGRYPPVIVRPMEGGGSGVYQILDGHHRVEALKTLGRSVAQCVVWDVDEDESYVLLATLNTLKGEEDVRKRASLVGELSHRFDIDELAKKLPECVKDLEVLLSVKGPPPALRDPEPLEGLLEAVYFFLVRSDRDRLEGCLKRLGGAREQGLMRMVEMAEGVSLGQED